jgi:uncharacterized SAM-binding protein YcdF (DUF218 family)
MFRPDLAEGHRHDEDSLSQPTPPHSPGKLRELTRRVPLARIIEGGAIGVALWCILFAFQLLPGDAADTPGVLFFGVAGSLARASGLHRSLMVILVLAAAMVVVVTQTLLSNAVASNWVREDHFPDSGVAAVVVLSAGLNPNETITGEALDHLINGLELVQARKANVLVTTTVEERFPAGVVSSAADQSRIVSLFHGDGSWIRTPTGQSTRDEALRSAQLLLPRGIRRIAVVASPMHTRRACSSFEAVGFEVVCVPARLRSPGGQDPGPWPADRLKVFGDWVYEVVATAEYQTRGWLANRTRPVRAP